MSVSLLLIPGALAIAGAVGGVGALGFHSQRRAGQQTEGAEAEVDTAEGGASGQAAPVAVQVRTRMKDAALLAASLTDLGAVDLEVSDSAVSATVGARRLSMELDAEGIWEAHVENSTEAEAAELIGTLDAAYAFRVQQTIAERIRQRAGDAGFSLLSETRQNDRSLTMVLEVRGGAA